MGIIDIAIIIILGLFIIFGVVKGFVRQLFSLGAWVFAIAVPMLLSKTVTNMFAKINIDSILAKNSFIFILLFFITFIIIKTIGHFIGKSAQKGALGWVDRLLGFVWGATKAVLLISLVLLLAKSLTTFPVVGQKVLDFLTTDLKLGNPAFMPGRFLYENNLLVMFIETLN